MAFLKNSQPRRGRRSSLRRVQRGWGYKSPSSRVGIAGAGKPSLAPQKPAPSKPSPAKPPAKPVGRSRQPDSQYYASVDLAGRQQTSRLGQLEGQEQAIKHDFGIEDPTNPFSRAEGLKRMFLQRFRGTSAGIASQGHLYSGQHERALARVRRDEEEARAGLRSAYEGAIGQIGAAKAGVKFETEEQRLQAFEDWLARTPDSEAVAAPAATKAPAAPKPSAPKNNLSQNLKHVPKDDEIADIIKRAGSPDAPRSMARPVKNPNAQNRGDTEARLRARLQQARKNGNQQRVRRIRRRLRNLNRGRNGTRG